MADLRGFNANDVAPSTFEPIPAGRYLAVITESDMRPNKAGTGEYLQLTFEIIEGQYKGRLLWTRLNIVHPNATAAAIARAELASICRAVGVMAPQDSTELHNLPLVVNVQLKRRDDTGELTNHIKGYAPKAPLNGTPAAGKATDATAEKTTTPPWKR
jgi:hypothetical protein